MKTHPMTTIAPEDTDKKKEVVINDDNPNPFLTAVRAYEVKNLKLATIFGVVVFIISMMEMIPKINQPPQWLDKVPCTFQSVFANFIKLISAADTTSSPPIFKPLANFSKNVASSAFHSPELAMFGTWF